VNLEKRTLWIIIFCLIGLSIVLIVAPHWKERRQSCDREAAEGQVDSAADSEPEPDHGIWHRVGLNRAEAEDESLTEEEREELRRLEAIGYLSGYRAAPQRKGITVLDRQRAYNGLNLYNSAHAPEAALIDMEGNELHRWRYEAKRSWPDLEPVPGDHRHEFFRRVYAYENGDLLAIFEGIGLVKIDKDSNLIWDYDGHPHHDMFVTEDGLIYVLTRRLIFYDEKGEERRFYLEDFIVILDGQGKEVKKVSILKGLYNSPYVPGLIAALKAENYAKTKGDIFHTNTVELLDGRLEGLSKAFSKGNVLISIRHLDLIGVVDMNAQTMVWGLSGMWSRQHQPTVLKSGNMLVFDNEGLGDYSRVLEFDPLTQEVFWEYRGDPKTPFSSEALGSVDRMPNGNTLITESGGGRAFEVTPEKQIVWEFLNPHRSGPNNELIATLLEVQRLEPDFPHQWARERSPESSTR